VTISNICPCLTGGWIAVGDVSGKGIPAAMLMAIITTAMRDEVARNAKPAALLDALNQRLLERMKATHVNSALLVGIFDPATRRIEIANGGMVQPYVRNGKTWEFVPVGGYPLGVSQRMSYTSKVVTLAPGAMLLMMSDGVVEAQNSAGEFYGFERLEVLLNSLSPDSSAQDVVDRIMAAVREYLEGEEPQDDLTILAIQSMEIPVTAGAAAVVVPETPVKPEKAETVPETKQAPEPAAATEKPAEAEITAKIVEAGAVGLEKTEKTTEVEVKPAAAATTAGDAPAAESKESDPKPEASPPDAAGASDSPDRTTTSASTPTTTTGSSAAATPNAAPGGTPVTPETPAEPGPAEPPEGE
jgi:hypothetical protein